MDTLAVDTLSMAMWRGNPEFDYASDFRGADFSLIDWIGLKIAQLLDALFGNKFYRGCEDIIWYVLGLAVIIAAIVFVAYKHPRLFGRRRHAKEFGYDVEEDNIYGFDFEAETEAAMTAHDYRRAVRMVYLHTLRLLSDSQRIAWQPSTTPTAYMREYADPQFGHMTHEFMRVRYGGFDATYDTAVAMISARQQIAADIQQQDAELQNTELQQNGGDK